MPTDGVHDPIGNKRKCGLAACNNDLDSNVSRTRAACPARGPPVPHAGRLSRTWAGLPRLGTAGPRADEKAQAPHSELARIAASLV